MLCSKSASACVKSVDWNIGREDFWKNLEGESYFCDLCESYMSDGAEFAYVRNDMLCVTTIFEIPLVIVYLILQGLMMIMSAGG